MEQFSSISVKVEFGKGEGKVPLPYLKQSGEQMRL